jgi:hypothetical protein
MNDVCLVCGNNILPNDKKYMLACDRPFFNLFIHRECWYNIRENLLDWLKINIEKIVEITNKSVKIR